MRKPASKPVPATATQGAARQSVRIIGGAWRGRRLAFPVAEGLRPTPDRIRETLFNWLQGRWSGVRVLDLFAGSGALGLEALSRGAAAAVLVESNGAVTAQLRATVTALGPACVAATAIVQTDGYRYLQGGATLFDGVFLDPPFADGREAELCTLLASRGWLAAGGWVYLERAASRGAPSLPPGFMPWHEGRAGEVGFYLVRWDPSTNMSTAT